MSKTKTTQELEYLVYDYFFLKRGLNCAMEVRVPYKARADFLGIDKSDEIIIVEIKASVGDFRSKNGHNFFGDKNYYALTEFVYSRVKDDIPNHIGVLIPSGRTLKVVKNAKTLDHKYPPLFIESIRKNIETAKQSNIRRLLYQRHRKNSKTKK